jgi:hypothetical protein
MLAGTVVNLFIKKGDAKCRNRGKGLNMPNCGKPNNKGTACSTWGKIHKKGLGWENRAMCT